MIHDPQCHRGANVRFVLVADKPYTLARCPGCGAVDLRPADRAPPPGADTNPHPPTTTEGQTP